MKAKLLKEHTHEGKKLPEGAVIELDQETYEWLAELKVAIYDSGDSPSPSVAVDESALPSVEELVVGDSPKKRFWGRSPVSDAPSEQV